jgi:hypothetical protein
MSHHYHYDDNTSIIKESLSCGGGHVKGNQHDNEGCDEPKTTTNAAVIDFTTNTVIVSPSSLSTYNTHSSSVNHMVSGTNGTHVHQYHQYGQMETSSMVSSPSATALAVVTPSPISSSHLSAPVSSSSLLNLLSSPTTSTPTPLPMRGWPDSGTSMSAGRQAQTMHNNAMTMVNAQRGVSESPVSELTRGVARVNMVSPLPPLPSSPSPSHRHIHHHHHHLFSHMNTPSPVLSSSGEASESPAPHSLSSPSPSSPYERSKSRSQSEDFLSTPSTSLNYHATSSGAPLLRPSGVRPPRSSSRRRQQYSSSNNLVGMSTHAAATPAEIRMRSASGANGPSSSGRASVPLPSPSHARNGSNDSISSDNGMIINPDFPLFNRSAPNSNLSSPTAGNYQFRPIPNDGASPPERSRTPSPLSHMGSPRSASPSSSASPCRSPSPSPVSAFGPSSRSGSSHNLSGFAQQQQQQQYNGESVIESGRRSGLGYRSMQPPAVLTSGLSCTAPSSARNSPMHLLRYLPQRSPTAASTSMEEEEDLTNHVGSQYFANHNNNNNGVIGAQYVQQQNQPQQQHPQQPIRYATLYSGEPSTPLSWGNDGTGLTNAFPMTPPTSQSLISSSFNRTAASEDSFHDHPDAVLVPDASAFPASPPSRLSSSLDQYHNDSGFVASLNGSLPTTSSASTSPSPSPPRLIPQSGVAPLVSTPRIAPRVSLFDSANDGNDEPQQSRPNLSVLIDDSASPPAGSPANGDFGSPALPPLTDSHATLIMRRTHSALSHNQQFRSASTRNASIVSLSSVIPSPRSFLSSMSVSVSSSLPVTLADSSPQRFPSFDNSSMGAPPPMAATLTRSHSVGTNMYGINMAMMNNDNNNNGAGVPSGRLEPLPTMNYSMPPSPSRRHRKKEHLRQQADPTYYRSQTPVASGPAARRGALTGVNQAPIAAPADYVHKLPTAGKVGCCTLITHDTLASVMRGDHKQNIDNVLVIDCRYPFEYEGGHIKGALNVTSQSQMESILFNPVRTNSERTAVVVHCEFSQARGPRGWMYIRENDRKMKGMASFGEFFYPELYVLQSGYREFHKSFPSLCERSSHAAAWTQPPPHVPLTLPAGSNMADEATPIVADYGTPLYTPMLHPSFAEQNRSFQRSSHTDWPKRR